jgi:hypothetical protein
LRPIAWQPGQRLAAPQRIRFAQQLRRMLDLAAVEYRASLSPKPTEAVQVNRLRIRF